MSKTLLFVLGLSGCVADPEVQPITAPLGTVARGEQLFEHETFDGNGRVCSTCHTDESGTISTQQVLTLLLTDPGNPLFRDIDSDEGLGLTYTRLATTATFRVEIPLPANVRLLHDPDARSVILNRSAPTFVNAALDPVIMWDGRQPTLEDQVTGAVLGHYEPGRLPELGERRDIARFERTVFSAPALRSFADGGPPPALPAGVTASERRGREFFLDVFDGTSKRGVCAACHTGPMLNEVTATFDVANGIPCPTPELEDVLGEDCPSTENPPAAPGSRFFTAFVSEFNDAANPPHVWVFTEPDGTERTIVSPDVGRALITGRFVDAELFEIPTLWGIERTAPYFHDGSAATLEELVEHYARFIALAFFGRIVLTPQDQADIVAFLRLL